MSKFEDAIKILNTKLSDENAKDTVNKITNEDVTNTSIDRQTTIKRNLLLNGEAEETVSNNEESYLDAIVSLDNPYSFYSTGSLARRGIYKYTDWSQVAEDWNTAFEDAEWDWNNPISTIINDAIGNGFQGAVTIINNGISSAIDSAYDLMDYMQTNSENGGLFAGLTGGSISLLKASTSAISLMVGAISRGYNDGVTETQFGDKQDTSWAIFVQAVKSRNSSYRINVIQNTPLNSQNGNLYGSMIMGAPFTFNERTDPLNRVTIQTFVKDKMFLSLTPGLPKYNGSRYESSVGDDITRQTLTANEMIEYLMQNGTNATNLSKDKRYYTFKPTYGKYFTYLETALNTIYIKLGLAANNDGENGFNLLTFFDGLDINEREPLEQYKGALGFFVNPAGAIAENISSNKTSLGLADEINANSEDWQRINAITGMGAAKKSVGRIMAGASWTTMKVRDVASSLFDNTVTGWKSGTKLPGKVLKAGFGLIKDTYAATTKDIGSVVQQMAVSNGMKVMYPELWNNSDYSKSMTFDFNFVSPYGDPESIFRYVYVPFLALMCLAMPRQADDNGYVSPFFVRADLPGVISSDLAFISNISYTKGGAQNLFTKDGLPRAISGSFTIEDLYPYLAMSKRISFLSANPSYTSFLDSMVGINAVYTNNNESALNDYFDKMINRANGKFTSKGLWNTYSKEGRQAHTNAAKAIPGNKMKQSPRSINWMRKS